MSESFADIVIYIALAAFYIFAIVPFLGFMLIGNGAKKNWKGYDYEPCLERGVKAHAVVFVVFMLVKAIIVKFF